MLVDLRPGELLQFILTSVVHFGSIWGGLGGERLPHHLENMYIGAKRRPAYGGVHSSGLHRAGQLAKCHMVQHHHSSTTFIVYVGSLNAWGLLNQILAKRKIGMPD